MDAAAGIAPTRIAKPRKSWSGLVTISLGFFGLQIGFALQNANVSRIFQTLSPNDPEILNNLPALWVAAPLTGLLIQPIIGHYSDRTWGRFGRRRPYFMIGAILAAASLVYFPLAPVLLAAAVALWVLDGSLNISMEPFRAFVGDMLGKDQHTAGYAIQTALIGLGAAVGSGLPWALGQLGIANEAAAGAIPDTVRYSFWIGAVMLVAAVAWTVFRTQEYSPAELEAFDGSALDADGSDTIRALAARTWTSAIAWMAAGAMIILAVEELALEKELYLLGAILIAYGVASIVAIQLARTGNSSNALSHIVGDFGGMPDVMKKLALAQFFTWSGLFIMWIYTTPVVGQYMFGSTDTTSAAYNAGSNWVGILFATYNLVAVGAALLLLPWLAARIGKVRTHMACLLAGAAGYASFLVIRDPTWLLLSEIGIGIAWASVLAMPYAILASSLPQRKLGIYMGLFNIFIVVPQLLVATVMGSVVKALFPTEPIYTMGFAAGVMALAALAMLRVREE